MSYATIAAEYQPILENIAEEKASLLSQRQELIAAQNILLKHEIDSLDLHYKIQGVEEKFNALVDQEQIIKGEIKRQVNYLSGLKRRQKEEEALNHAIDAYHEAIQSGTFAPHCPYTAKYLQKAWTKGYDHMASMSGALFGVTYAS